MDGESKSAVAAPSPWRGVYDRLVAADPAELDVRRLEQLAEAAFWLGRPREAISARQRAYARYRDAGDPAGAARSAWLLFHSHFDLDETAAAGGWLQRARKHAQEAPEQVEAGYVCFAEACWALYQGDTEAALALCGRALEAAQRAGERDLEALSLAVEGRVRIARSEPAEGLQRLDEAMVAVLGDELTQFITGWVYCLLLDTCHELGDVRRAGQWTELAVRWCEQRGHDSWYPGLCRLHQCELRSLHGEWSVAETEAVRAAEELAPFGDYLIADSQYLAGEIRRRKGDYRGAAEAFRHAHERGRDPQPGLALLWLAEGRAGEATVALRLALTGSSGTSLRRARLLAAHVRAELAQGGVEAAAASADALDRLAGVMGSGLLRAMADLATGAVTLGRGAPEAALPLLRSACAIFRELSCPYEAAEAQVLVGTAARELGDLATAELELDAARATFARLGADPDVAGVDALRAVETGGRDGLTAREVEVLRRVAKGRSNRQVATELVISEHTVARHVANIFGKLGVTSRSAATSYAYEHGLV